MSNEQLAMSNDKPSAMRRSRSAPRIVRSCNGVSAKRRANGPNHPSLATDLDNLARLYHAQGRHSEAEPIYQRALAIREKVFGPEHPELADLQWVDLFPDWEPGFELICDSIRAHSAFEPPVSQLPDRPP